METVSDQEANIIKERILQRIRDMRNREYGDKMNPAKRVLSDKNADRQGMTYHIICSNYFHPPFVRAPNWS